MAEIGFSLNIPLLTILLCSCACSFFPYAAASRSSLLHHLNSNNNNNNNLQTAVLDVAGAIERARRILSSDIANNSSAYYSTKSSSNSNSMQLLPRASLLRPLHRDYRSLTLARLARDSARVASLNSRANRRSSRSASTSSSTLMRSKAAAAAAAVDESKSNKAPTAEAPIVSGTRQGSGEYFSRIQVGTPPRPLYMVVDTGSDVSWLQCAPCADCYHQSDPIFDPASSSSYAPLSCSDPQCRSLDVSRCVAHQNQTSFSSSSSSSCLYEVSYGDGSFTLGDFATESLSLGRASLSAVALGCGHTNEGLFVGAAGLLGLGAGPLSLPSQINATSFSYCLVDRDSDAASTLDFNNGEGEDDTSSSSSSSSSTESTNDGNVLGGGVVVAAPLRRNRRLGTFFYVGLKGLSVGGLEVDIPAAAFASSEDGDGVIVDSGTAVSRLQADAYASLRDAFAGGTGHLRRAGAGSGASLFDTCYDLSSVESVQVPTVALDFEGGGSLQLPPHNYMIPVDESGTFCFAFAPTSASLSIIGNIQQQGTRVTFDLANSRLLFSRNYC